MRGPAWRSCCRWRAQLLRIRFSGRYRTNVFTSLVYILGLGFLSLSATLPSVSSNCDKMFRGSSSCSPPTIQLVIFYSSLYLVAIGQGWHKPCVQAFGADQFDGHDPEELKAKSSFFNWWYFGLCGGPLLALSALFYIQDNGLGFGIPCLIMGIALAVFLLGSRTYRYSSNLIEENPFPRIGRVFVTAARNWRSKSPVDDKLEAQGVASYQGSLQLNIQDVEDAKALVRLFPLWATSFVFAIVFAQPSTFLTKQGNNFSVPPASLHSFINLFIVIFIPIYDRVFVPVTRVFTGNSSGITMLLRIGIGMFMSMVSMVTAALVERKRIERLH
ncbi:NRT1/ PTR FAMILY 5.10-like protein [Drosera capensis]